MMMMMMKKPEGLTFTSCFGRLDRRRHWLVCLCCLLLLQRPSGLTGWTNGVPPIRLVSISTTRTPSTTATTDDITTAGHHMTDLNSQTEENVSDVISDLEDVWTSADVSPVIHVWTHTHTHTHSHIHTHTLTHTLTHLDTHTHIYTHTYTHIHTH